MDRADRGRERDISAPRAVGSDDRIADPGDQGTAQIRLIRYGAATAAPRRKLVPARVVGGEVAQIRAALDAAPSR